MYYALSTKILQEADTASVLQKGFSKFAVKILDIYTYKEFLKISFKTELLSTPPPPLPNSFNSPIVVFPNTNVRENICPLKTSANFQIKSPHYRNQGEVLSGEGWSTLLYIGGAQWEVGSLHGVD